MKLTWLAMMSRDRRITDLQFRIAHTISTYTNRETNSAFPSLDTISAQAHHCKRATASAVAALEVAGYLEVVRNEIGHRKDGRRVCGGRGKSNTYRISFPPGHETMPEDATFYEQKEAANDEKRGMPVPPNSYLTKKEPSKRVQYGRASRSAYRSRARPQHPAGKVTAIWLQPGTPPFKAWKEHFSRNGSAYQLSRLKECEEQRTAWPARSEWPPMFEASLPGFAPDDKGS
jgi:hypothetical protein